MIKKIIILFHCLIIGTLILNAQVTIGTDIKPNKGSLLDLKENGNTILNSNKGLMLPKVLLTDINNLFPMFGDKNALNELYDTPEEKQQQDLLHTGLMVYNTNTIEPDICPGIYLWIVSNWQRLPNPCPNPYDNFEIDLEGPSCTYTDRQLTFTSSLTGQTENLIVDRWTITNTNGVEKTIASEKGSILNYKFPLQTTTPGKYSFTVYYKHKNMQEEKSATKTVEVYDSILQDYVIQTVTGTRTYKITAEARKRLANNQFGDLLPLNIVKWSYLKAGTTTEVDMNQDNLEVITFQFPSSGTYYIKMTWEFPCYEDLDPEPANNTETPRSVVHNVVVGKLNVP